MHWLYLGIAVVFEITVAISAGKAQGFTRPAWTIATLVSGGIATYLLSLALLNRRRRLAQALRQPQANADRAACSPLTTTVQPAVGHGADSAGEQTTRPGFGGDVPAGGYPAAEMLRT